MRRNFTIKQYGEDYGPGRSKTYELIKEGKLHRIKYGRLDSQIKCNT